MSIAIEIATKYFADTYGVPPEVVASAPGRVNLLGEHTDYNHGYVLPMAIERNTVICARKRRDLRLRAYAVNFAQHADLDTRAIARQAETPWADYILGVLLECRKLGHACGGADLIVVGDVPLGGGLSSSASLEMAALTAFEALDGFRIEGPEGPKLGQRVENAFLGVSSGIMDQFIVRHAKAGHAIMLDCRSLAYEQIPVELEGACFVIADTGVSRGLAASKYNERVAECRRAVEGLCAATGRTATHLRDFTQADLAAHAQALDAVALKRARHVIGENERTRAACAALQRGDARALGALMNASDASLREDYEVTCRELDAMCAIARALDGCHGARMTGAGFGGCTLHLVETARAAAFADALLAAYGAETGRAGRVIVSRAAPGATVHPA